MGEVSIPELRDHAEDVIARVAAGERITVTRDDEPVAELTPLSGRAFVAKTMIERVSSLPHMDGPRLRVDLDEVIDPLL